MITDSTGPWPLQSVGANRSNGSLITWGSARGVRAMLRASCTIKEYQAESPFALSRIGGPGPNMVEEALYRRNAFSRALQRVGNKYAMVNIVAKRAHELASGAPPMIHTASRDPHIIAVEEVAAGKLRVNPAQKAEEEESFP